MRRKSQTQHIIDSAPTGAKALIDGLFYKVGRMGKPYFFNGIEWVKSDRPLYQVQTEIRSQEYKFSRRPPPPVKPLPKIRLRG